MPGLSAPLVLISSAVFRTCTVIKWNCSFALKMSHSFQKHNAATHKNTAAKRSSLHVVGQRLMHLRQHVICISFRCSFE